MKIKQSIFKEYDIRGRYPNEISKDTAYKIGRALAIFLKLKHKNKIIVARDGRPSSPALSKAFVTGIIDSGASAIDIGMVTTPTLYFAVPFLKADGGAMITASHNPISDNGIKLVKKESEPLNEKSLLKIYEIANNLPDRLPGKLGEYKKLDVEKDYLEATLNDYKINKPGFSYSFDYDGDRLMLKNKNGKEIRGDIAGGIMADTVANAGDTIVYDVRCSHGVVKYFENKGIIAAPSRTGHSNIKKLMREKNAIFGMEITGHYYFKKFHYCESPLYGIKKIAEKISESGKNIDELSKPFMKYCHSGIINTSDKGGQIEKIIEKLKEEYKNGAQNELDGLTVEFSNWWFNIQPSQTEPIIRLVIETKTPQLLAEKKKELLKLIS